MTFENPFKNPVNYIEYATKHLNVGNYSVGISSLGSAIEMIIERSDQPKNQLHQKAAHAFLELAKRLDASGKKDGAQNSLFLAKQHYVSANNNPKSDRLKRWDDYLYSKNSEVDIQSETLDDNLITSPNDCV